MNWTHRKRIIIAVIGLSLCTQIVLVLIGIIGANRMDREIEAQARAKLLDSASHNIAAYFSQMTSMISFLQSGELGEYVSSYLGLQDADSIARKTDRVNAVLGQIRLSDSLIDSIYLLGNFSFQRSVVIRAGQQYLSEETAPTVDDLVNANLLPILHYMRNRPIVFRPGELTGRLRISPAMPPAQEEDVRKLAKELEGRVILNGGVIEANPKSFIVIVVLKENLLASLANADEYDSFTLADPDGRIIDRTAPLTGKDVVSQEKTIDASGLKLTLHTQRSAGAGANKSAFLRKYMLFFMTVTALTFLIAQVFSRYLILPFRKLSHRMTKQHLVFPLQYLRPDEVNKGVLPSFSLQKKLVVLFFIAVCLPSLSSGVAYDRFLHSFAVQQMKPAVKRYADQVGMNIRRQSVMYVDLIRKLSLNQTFIQQLTSQSLGRASAPLQAPDISFLEYSGINDASYFVLYNLLGTLVYTNQNAQSFNYLTLDGETRQRIDRANDAIWLSNGRDLFNQPTVSLVKAVFDINSPSLRPIGYIQIVFAQSAFQSILPQNDAFTATLDASGNLLFKNDMLRKTSGISLSKAGSSPEYIVSIGRPGVALVYDDKDRNWRTHFMEPTDAVDAVQRELIVQYASVIVVSIAIAMLLAFGLSRWLLRSLEHLKLAMNNQIEEAKMDRRIAVAGKGKDEISELIENYNRMLTRINGLMEENIRIAEENSLGRMKQQELQSLKMQAELNMLQLQINPHFLYNTLQSIGMRSKGSGDEEASFMIYALADLFRYSIGQDGHDGHHVDLAEEIRHTRNYLTIQEFRFKNKFSVEWNVSEEALSCRTIRFILQPLVENAITHGFLNSIRSGTVWIDASLSMGELILSVRDNGMGIEPKRLAAIKEKWGNGMRTGKESEGTEEAHAPLAGGTGIGLNNVFHRLRLFYDGAAKMEIESEWFEGTSVRLVIPQPIPRTR
ncbi:sensor histidine kinase [Paenibacillus sp. GCM10027626]|uniref:sensor histidine kinase n=1 Tax=Paenibacillus sp. GCM10027626 TaxID=3273411 RepID=UPI00363E3757